MDNLSHRNEAGNVLTALTGGPTPGVQGWEIRESGVNVHGVAHAILVVNGHDFAVEVTPYEDGE
jgi:hypothetical protein